MKPLTNEERNAIYLEAMTLLIDRNLTWSNDFEAIRPALCSLFLKAMTYPEQNVHALPLATKVIQQHG